MGSVGLGDGDAEADGVGEVADSLGVGEADPVPVVQPVASASNSAAVRTGRVVRMLRGLPPWARRRDGTR